MFLNTLYLSSSFFIVLDQEPESHDAGVSRNTGTGSYLKAMDAAESPVGQVAGSGSSGNAENGSHLKVAGFSDESGRFCDGG